MTCKKCFATLNPCPYCKGKRNNNCSTCANTGMVCVTHGGFHGH